MKADILIKEMTYPKERLRGYDMKDVPVTEIVLDSEYINVVELFKKNFPKPTKELWDIIKNPEGRTSKELKEQINLMMSMLSFLEDMVVETERYEDE